MDELELCNAILLSDTSDGAASWCKILKNVSSIENNVGKRDAASLTCSCYAENTCLTLISQLIFLHLF